MYIDINELKKLFPFERMRRQQPYVLQEIAKAVNEGYKFILMQLPVGFGKSPVAVDVALAMGKSYIATVNINLQKQYYNDFKFLKRIMGKTNFPCLVKEDQINDGTFSCDPKCYFPSKPNT
jgi:ATP-dependent DNA helicase DinG